MSEQLLAHETVCQLLGTAMSFTWDWEGCEWVLYLSSGMGSFGFVGEVVERLWRTRIPTQELGRGWNGKPGECCIGGGRFGSRDEVSSLFCCVDSVQRGSEVDASWCSAEPVCSCDGDYVVVLFLWPRSRCVLLSPDCGWLWQYASGLAALRLHHACCCLRIRAHLVRVQYWLLSSYALVLWEYETTELWSSSCRRLKIRMFFGIRSIVSRLNLHTCHGILSFRLWFSVAWIAQIGTIMSILSWLLKRHAFASCEAEWMAVELKVSFDF